MSRSKNNLTYGINRKNFLNLLQKNRLAKVFILLFFIILTGTIAVSFFSTKLQIQSTQEVVFCGEKYTSDRLMIGGVEVVQRISQISKNNSSVCPQGFADRNNRLGISIKRETAGKSYFIVLYDRNNSEQRNDPFNQSVNIFRLDQENDSLYLQSQFDGSFRAIGSL